jgi:hypothetical protein
MGCDIHAHSEIKIDGTWHHLSALSINRNYKLFEKMAGVRGDPANAIAAPRGLPTDAAFLTHFAAELWNGDGRTHSWLTAAEVCEVGDFLKGSGGCSAV